MKGIIKLTEIRSPGGSVASVPTEWLHRFEKRRGYGSAGALLDLFNDPSNPLAEIAKIFNVQTGTVPYWRRFFRVHNRAIPRRLRMGVYVSALTKEQWANLFNANHGAGSYDKLVNVFERNCSSLREIGTEFGVSRERARQWHVRLAPDYPSWEPTGRERRKACTLIRAGNRPFPKQLLPVVTALRNLELRPKIYIYRSGRYLKTRTKALYLNGRLCLVHCCAGPIATLPRSTGRNIKYWRFSCDQKPPGVMLLFACGDPITEIYAVPSGVVAAHYKRTVYIPINYEQFVKHDARRFDWRPYREPWGIPAE